MTPRCVAVVLAGGRSRRFGADKLDAEVEGLRLLDAVLTQLPAAAEIIVVGPPRALQRPVRFVRETPAGGGPAAGLVAGLTEALRGDADEFVVLPGDAPMAGQAAELLLKVLRDSAVAAVVGTDPAGVEQPLQLALTRPAAVQLVEAAGPDAATNGSARALVSRLDPAALAWSLSTATHFDIDTQEQLLSWTGRNSLVVTEILTAGESRRRPGRPLVIALDGRRATGKTVLAAALTLHHAATVVVPGDDFHATELAGLSADERGRWPAAQVADRMLDWRRLREQVMARLAGGRPPADLLVVEGVYTARPELADLVDLAVCVEADPAVRRSRVRSREQGAPEWVSFAERGEDYYFDRVRPVSSYDLRVTPPPLWSSERKS